ncbi:MAG: hypothetical protein ACSLFO_02630 [Acidimicrobiales bacterium]
MTTTAPERTRDEPPADVEPTSERRWPRLVVLVLCALVLVFAALRVGAHDPTELQVSGDQATFTLNALSIAGGDLSYDEQDYDSWLDLDWEVNPRGLFMQRTDEGWAFAKPYGYSVLLAPFVNWFGADGISYANAGLLLAYAWCWYAIGRTRWRPAAAAMVATTATVASNAWPMAFPAHADLFVAVVVGVAVLAGVRVVLGRAVDRGVGAAVRAPLGRAATILWPCLAVVAAAVLVTEKLPALVAVGPLLAVALWRAPWRGRIPAVLLGLAVVAVSVVPYLDYSEGASWNAYGGDRYYAPAGTPWAGANDPAATADTADDIIQWRTRDTMSAQKVLDNITDPSEDIPHAALTYAVGRHTGALTNQPVVATLAAAAIGAVVLRRRRRARAGTNDADDDGDVQAGPEESGDRSYPWWTPALVAAAVGLVGYAALYLVTFTDNYFGGGQSVGNRYFLQISVLVAVVPVAARITERAAATSAVLGAAVAYALITPHLVEADDAFFHIERTTSLGERLLPFEHTQSGNWRLQCDPEVDCDPPPLAPALSN